MKKTKRNDINYCLKRFWCKKSEIKFNIPNYKYIRGRPINNNNIKESYYPDFNKGYGGVLDNNFQNYYVINIDKPNPELYVLTCPFLSSHINIIFNILEKIKLSGLFKTIKVSCREDIKCKDDRLERLFIQRLSKEKFMIKGEKLNTSTWYNYYEQEKN